MESSASPEATLALQTRYVRNRRIGSSFQNLSLQIDCGTPRLSRIVPVQAVALRHQQRRAIARARTRDCLEGRLVDAITSNPSSGPQVCRNLGRGTTDPHAHASVMLVETPYRLFSATKTTGISRPPPCSRFRANCLCLCCISGEWHATCSSRLIWNARAAPTASGIPIQQLPGRPGCRPQMRRYALNRPRPCNTQFLAEDFRHHPLRSAPWQCWSVAAMSPNDQVCLEAPCTPPGCLHAT